MSSSGHDHLRPSPIGRALGGAKDALLRVGRIGEAVGSALRLPGLPSSRREPFRPGAPAGIESIPLIDVPPEPGQVHIHCIDYGPERVRSTVVTDLEAFLAEPRPEWAKTRWINVDGLHPFIVNRFREHFDLHTLAAEDVLHVPQRPRADPYEHQLFVVLRMVGLKEDHLVSEQVSMFLFDNLLLTFQEHPGDVWDPIRARLENETSRLRKRDAGFLLYTLLDAIVDHAFPLLERYGEILSELEEEVMESPDRGLLRRIQSIKRELVTLRRILWPTRELLDFLDRGEDVHLHQSTRTYLRDVYSHTIQLLDIMESYRELCGNLTELYMSFVSHRMNEIMKVLTVMASLFIPVTFLAGVYGMNFEYLPELKWRYGYYGFWAVCASMVGTLLWYFRSRGWLGRD